MHYCKAAAHKRSHDLHVCSDIELTEEATASFAHIVWAFTLNLRFCGLCSRHYIEMELITAHPNQVGGSFLLNGENMISVGQRFGNVKKCAVGNSPKFRDIG